MTSCAMEEAPAIGAAVYALPNGSSCTRPTQCDTGYWLGSICCNSACGGGNNSDCQACNTVPPYNGKTDDTCTELKNSVATSQLCRPAVDRCDSAACQRAGIAGA